MKREDLEEYLITYLSECNHNELLEIVEKLGVHLPD